MAKVVGNEFWKERLIKAMEPLNAKNIEKLRKMYRVPSGLTKQDTIRLIAEKILSQGTLARFIAMAVIDTLRKNNK